MLDAIVLIVVVAMPAIVLHELAHGWVAYKLGDPTAKLMGRLTINPIKRIDLWGTIIIPGTLFLIYTLGLTPSHMLFGWAKPVPVNFFKLKPLRLGIFLVAIAGVVVNIFLAWVLVQWYKRPSLSAWDHVIGWGVLLNLTLAVFNMVPIPPLDGSRVVTAFLPAKAAQYYNRLEPFGLFIIIIMLQLGLLRFLYPLISQLGYLLGVQL